MAEKSFRRPFIGSMASTMGVVPISRAMDNAKPGRGTIYLEDPTANPLLLRGIDTDFTGPDFKPGYSIYLPTINGESHKLDIAEIQGPTLISLKTAPAHEDATFQLTGSQDLSRENVPGFRGSQYKIAPRVDQTAVYNAVFAMLEAEGCIGIFPEGGSHDRTSLLPLKGTFPFLPCLSIDQAQLSDILQQPVLLSWLLGLLPEVYQLPSFLLG